MDEVLDMLPTAQMRSNLLRELVENTNTHFQLEPSGQEALFAALTGEEETAALRQLLDHLKLDPLTRWVVLHPRPALPPLTPPSSPQLLPDLNEFWGSNFVLRQSPLGSQPLDRPLPRNRITVVRRMGALADGTRVSVHFEEVESLEPSTSRARRPTTERVLSPHPIALGHRPRPESFANTLAGLSERRRRQSNQDNARADAFPASAAWQKRLVYDGAADLADRRSLEALATTHEARMPLLGEPVFLAGRGVIYRTALADYLFATPQVVHTPYQSRRLPPSVTMAYGWYKPLGQPAEPMEMVQTNPWGANF